MDFIFIFIFILLAAFIVFCIFMFLKTTGIKNKQRNTINSKSTATTGPITIVTEYEPSEIPSDIARDMRKFYTMVQAHRDFEIMRESFQIANSTHNLDTFCMRHKLAIQKAHTLLQAERVGVKGIEKLKCHDICIKIINLSHSLKLVALDNFSNHEFAQAETLKTNRGKVNRYIKMYNTLIEVESEFQFIDEYDSLLGRLRDLIESLGGIIPETQVTDE